jgi:hypothetical protein
MAMREMPIRVVGAISDDATKNQQPIRGGEELRALICGFSLASLPRSCALSLN